ncbi:MAG: hypothetical protein IT326_07590 [Anaerolineae bacterium]|nr:hypothetical protein [Anaerolineae bacterium]
MASPAISVNVEQARRMAERFVQLGWQRQDNARPAREEPPAASTDHLIDYFFYTSMLLFDFKNMEHTYPDGTYIKGTDVFIALCQRAMHRNPDWFTAQNFAALSDEDYLRAFSFSDDPSKPDVIRMPERIAVLRDAAKLLLGRYGGKASGMLAEHPTLRHDPTTGKPGLLDVIRDFRGFDDPLYKKVFVFLKSLDIRDIWKPADPENVMMPVDYHVIRMALRNGVVTVHDEVLAQKLREAAPATLEEEQLVREATLEACHQMVKFSGLTTYFIDDIYWLVGRSCCHYNRPPRCGACDFSDCSVQPAMGYTCPGKCPLATHCLGATDEAYKTLLEPAIVTQYY